jgi:hypothetical protein
MPNPKKIKQIEAAIETKQGSIDLAAGLVKKWKKLTGPMTPKDEQILASGKHGTHGKVTYEKAVDTLETNLTQAKRELKKLQDDLAKEQAN